MQYTPLPTDDFPSSELPPPAKKLCRQLTRPRTFLLLLGILFPSYLAILYDLQSTRFGSSAIDRLASSLKLQKPLYVIIIDAGSTGTRLSVFTFHSSIINGDFVLDNEVYEELEPGLSDYADTPEEVAKQLKKLINKAKSVIPKDSWGQTPLGLKATAGLRLLSEAKANVILDECRNFLKKSGFLMSPGAISIMGGVDEGIYAWFTVNFIFNRLTPHSISNPVAVLDLGGGSTQVTYIPHEDDIKQLDNHTYAISVFNRNLSLYTQSYLGMGIMAARRGILTLDVNSSKEIGDSGLIKVRSECINPIIETNWTYGGCDYMVRGPVNASYKIVKTQNFGGSDEKRPIVNVKDCRSVVKRYIDTIKDRPIGLKKHEIYAISYYFDLATGAGLIDPFKGGVITLNTFYKGTVDVCNYPNADQPFTCLEMIYIYVLLKEGFSLDGSTKLNLYKKYKGHAMNWALGAAFNIYQSDL